MIAARIRDAHVRLLAWRCVTDAKRTMGDGWAHIGDELRWGLVCANALAVVAGQHAIDDLAAPMDAKARIADFTYELWLTIAEYRERGWKKS